MANYKDLHGFEIKHRSSDPSNPIEGEIWYNTTTQTLKVAPKISAWASGGNMGTARYSMSGAGTQTAAIGAGGYLPGLSPFAGARNTEEYDGTSWTNGGDMNQGKHEMGQCCGTQTATLASTGYAGTANLNNSEEYDGSSWTATGALNTAKRSVFRGMGTQTAGACIGGKTDNPYPSFLTQVEEYDGSSWTEVTDIPTATAGGACSGTQTAGLVFGGSSPSRNSTCLEYDGTNWTSGGSLPAARGAPQSSNGPGGTQTAAGQYGGSDSGGTKVTACNNYDGTSWSSIPSLGTAKQDGGGGGSQTAAIVFGGQNPGSPLRSNKTEEFTDAVTVRSVDTS